MTNADGLPSPRDPDPRHLYIADDGTKTVVALLAPDVDGTAERTTLGGITTVRPHPVTRAATPHGRVETLPAEVQLSAPRSGGARIALLGSGSGVVAGGAAMYLLSPWAGLPVIAAGIAVSGWQALRRHFRVEQTWTAGHRVLRHYEDQRAFRAAAADARFTLSQWPALCRHLPLEDPSPTLTRTLWDLAQLLVDRAAVRETRARLLQAGRGVPPTSAVGIDVAARCRQSDDALTRLNAAIEDRLQHLSRLATEVDLFVRQEQALIHARATLRDADQVIGSINGPGTETGTAAEELAERTAAVIGAYQDLTGTSNEP
jgi:hypothetical protein